MTRTLAIVLLLLAWGATGYWAGDKNRNNAWLAKQAVAERKAHQAYETEVKRGNKAALQSIADQQALQKSYSTLEEKFNELRAHSPLVVYRNNGVAGPAAQPPQALPGTDAGAAVGLSLGAVWVWNSALAGADTPAGACGAADTAAPACALDAGVSLDAAWANHIANAQTCAQDRLRHQRLIDFITTGQHP